MEETRRLSSVDGAARKLEDAPDKEGCGQDRGRDEHGGRQQRPAGSAPQQQGPGYEKLISSGT